MNGEVNEVINNICDKLGYAASEITPEMARYMIARNAVGIGLCILFTAIAVTICILAKKSYSALSEHDKEWNSTMQVAAMIISIALSALLMLLLCFITIDLVGWIASPKASMVEYVLNAIK